MSASLEPFSLSKREGASDEGSSVSKTIDKGLTPTIPLFQEGTCVETPTKCNTTTKNLEDLVVMVIIVILSVVA